MYSSESIVHPKFSKLTETSLPYCERFENLIKEHSLVSNHCVQFHVYATLDISCGYHEVPTMDAVEKLMSDRMNLLRLETLEVLSFHEVEQIHPKKFGNDARSAVSQG